MRFVTVDPMFLGDRLCFNYSNYPPTTFNTVFPFLSKYWPYRNVTAAIESRKTSLGLHHPACDCLRQEEHSLFLFICFDVLIPGHCEIQNCPVLQVWSITETSDQYVSMIFLYCYPSDCHHSNGGRPDFYLLVVVICQIYFALKTKLSIHPQTRSTVSHLLQYLLFHQLRTSFY